jgi:hypothetical protein
MTAPKPLPRCRCRLTRATLAQPQVNARDVGQTGGGMLDELQRYIDVATDIDDPSVKLRAARWSDECDLELELQVRPVVAETDGCWTVRATRVREAQLCDSDGDLVLAGSDHVAATQYLVPQCDVTFTGTPVDVARTIGLLWLAHRRVAGSSIAFSRYINDLVQLEELLGGGYGRLADGPEFLIEAYAEVLSGEGMKVALSARRPPKRWSGSAWVLDEPPLAVLVLDGTLIVAADFEVVAFPTGWRTSHCT